MGLQDIDINKSILFESNKCISLISIRVIIVNEGNYCILFESNKILLMIIEQVTMILERIKYFT